MDRTGITDATPSADPDPALNASAREFLDAAPDAIVGVNEAGRIAFVNRQAERTFGYRRDEMVGRPIELLLPDEMKAAHARHRSSYQAAPVLRPMGVGLDLIARRKDGSQLPVEISLSPLSTARGVEIIAAIRDVSERRRSEQERERLLETAGRARAEAEEALRARADAERLKDDLFNMVVHDLKSPVNGIAMTVQLLLRKGELSQSQRQSLLRTERTCRDLLRLIGNILDIARIEAGEMPVASEAIALADLVDEVVAEYEPVASAMGRGLKVEVGTELPPAIGDRALLKRVLVNLLANALRHSGSTDVCVAAAADPTGPHVNLLIEDHGHGIPESDQAVVFSKFKTARGDASADTGLGLPFCKLAVERMAGQIVLRSTPGVGTTFSLVLPCAAQ